MSGTSCSDVPLYSDSSISSALSRMTNDIGTCGRAIRQEVFCTLAVLGAKIDVGWDDEVGA